MLTIIVLLATASWTCLAYFQSTVSLKDQIVHDRLYEDYVLWETYSTSLRECSAFCTTDERCWAFSFRKNSTGINHFCRGYSKHRKSLDSGSYSVSVGVVFFQVFSRWINNTKVADQSGAFTQDTSVSATVSSGENLSTEMTTPQVTSPASENSTCSSHSDCTSVQNNTACYSSLCVCSPGYYYSVSTGVCILECTTENLTTSFTRYPRHTIAWRDDETHDVTSLQECFNHCVTSNISCRSIDFKHSGWSALKCYLSSTVALNMGPTSFVTLFSFDHYQRQCL